MKKYIFNNILFLITILLNLGCAHSMADNYRYISVTELISNPDMYHEKKVVVYGLVNIANENQVIIDKDCNLSGKLSGNSVWIQFIGSKKPDEYSKKELDEYLASKLKYKSFKYKCAWVEGTYDKGIKGSWGSFVGGLKDIKDIRENK